ncbi:hypothetical protein MMC13_004067 [Lambiella insularis]|nr:hypothetical protein [Lambiella insularis]
MATTPCVWVQRIGDPHHTAYPIPFGAVPTYEELVDILRQLVYSKGELVIYNWHETSIILPSLWPYFLINGAIFKYAVIPIVQVLVYYSTHDPVVAVTIKCNEEMSIFNLRGYIHNLLRDTTPYVAPGSLLDQQKLFPRNSQHLHLEVKVSGKPLWDKMRIKDYLEWGTDVLALVVSTNLRPLRDEDHELMHHQWNSALTDMDKNYNLSPYLQDNYQIRLSQAAIPDGSAIASPKLQSELSQSTGQTGEDTPRSSNNDVSDPVIIRPDQQDAVSYAERFTESGRGSPSHLEKAMATLADEATTVRKLDTSYGSGYRGSKVTAEASDINFQDQCNYSCRSTAGISSEAQQHNRFGDMTLSECRAVDEFCAFYVLTGGCSAKSHGCPYLHQMPCLDILKEMGLDGYPAWFVKGLEVTSPITATQGETATSQSQATTWPINVCKEWLWTGQCETKSQGCAFLHNMPSCHQCLQDPALVSGRVGHPESYGKEVGRQREPIEADSGALQPVAAASDDQQGTKTSPPENGPACGVRFENEPKMYCRNWMVSGHCTHGTACQFVHELPSVSQMKEVGFKDYPKWYKAAGNNIGPNSQSNFGELDKVQLRHLEAHNDRLRATHKTLMEAERATRALSRLNHDFSAFIEEDGWLTDDSTRARSASEPVANTTITHSSKSKSLNRSLDVEPNQKPEKKCRDLHELLGRDDPELQDPANPYYAPPQMQKMKSHVTASTGGFDSDPAQLERNTLKESVGVVPQKAEPNLELGKENKDKEESRNTRDTSEQAAKPSPASPASSSANNYFESSSYKYIRGIAERVAELAAQPSPQPEAQQGNPVVPATSTPKQRGENVWMVLQNAMPNPELENEKNDEEECWSTRASGTSEQASNPPPASPALSSASSYFESYSHKDLAKKVKRMKGLAALLCRQPEAQQGSSANPSLFTRQEREEIRKQRKASTGSGLRGRERNREMKKARREVRDEADGDASNGSYASSSKQDLAARVQRKKEWEEQNPGQTYGYSAF